jgi:alkanesulfonate monooxygenase SsuD/methylene tetrahydromethanopterin reductase-like flavin-dependent oxidoreductase (luciferase family)
MDEYLPSLRRLLLGHPVTFDGTFVTLDDVRIEPTPDPAIKITVGGRSGAALRRAARQGDGWVGIWVTPQRFAESVQEISEQAHAVNRGFVEFEHALSLWCAFDLQGRPRELLARTMEEIYRLSFSTFERYATWGNSAEVADSLVPFLGAGCRTFNLMCPGERFEEAIQGASEVSSILNEILSSTRADWGCHRSGDGY